MSKSALEKLDAGVARARRTPSGDLDLYRLFIRADRDPRWCQEITRQLLTIVQAGELDAAELSAQYERINADNMSRAAAVLSDLVYGLKAPTESSAPAAPR